jgi:hypothetical protein
MKCPRCGNEVSQEEAFCGQCGTPNTPPANPTEMYSTPPPHSGRLGTQYPGRPFTSARQQTFPPGTQAPSYTNASPSSSFPSQQNPATNQQTGFYQDATEAISAVPGTPDQTYHPGYSQQGFSGTSMAGGYPGSSQFGPQTQQSFQSGHYTGQMPPTQQSFPTGQGYDYGTYGTFRTVTPPPPKPSRGPMIAVICVCLVLVVIAGIGVANFVITRNQTASQGATATAVTATAVVPSPTATVVATPTPDLTATASAAATPTAEASPSPTASPMPSPTPAPDANFSWCGQTCQPYGFQVEYPDGWQMGQATNAIGEQFTNPTQSDQYASFKAPGPTNSSANDLVNNDLQTNFASKTGYTAPTTTSSTTISGTTWITAVAYYLSDTQQKERVQVFATVYQQKAYIIELQAPDSQFDGVNSQYFNLMINHYQFL